MESTRAKATTGGVIGAGIITVAVIMSGGGGGGDSLDREARRSEEVVLTGFVSKSEAYEFSALKMRQVQTPETIADPNTGTRFLFTVEDGGDEWGVIIIPSSETNSLNRSEQLKLDRRGVRGGKWNKEAPNPVGLMNP